jgi:hypothetical protein
VSTAARKPSRSPAPRERSAMNSAYRTSRSLIGSPPSYGAGPPCGRTSVSAGSRLERAEFLRIGPPTLTRHRA